MSVYKMTVLYLSSWKLFDGNKVLIPFVYEQIGCCSKNVNAVFVEPHFCTLIDWLKLFHQGSWVVKMKSPWLAEGYVVEYFQVYLPKISTRITRHGQWQDFNWAGYWLGNLIRKGIGAFDIIHLHTILPLGGFAMGIKRRLKVPFLLQEHSAPFEMHCDTEKNTQGVKEVCHAADLILPVGKDLRLRMLRYHPFSDKFNIIPNWVRTDIFKPDGHKIEFRNKLSILTVCSAQKQKRHDRFLLLIKEMLKSGMDVRASIIGFGKSSNQVNELIEQLGLQSYVTLFDKMKKRELLKYYRDADIYICTSDHETFGIAPAEAIACGTPVLTTACGGPEFFVNEDCGEVSSDRTVEAMHNSLLNIILKLNSYDHTKMWESIHNQFGKEKYRKTIQVKYESLLGLDINALESRHIIL